MTGYVVVTTRDKRIVPGTSVYDLPYDALKACSNLTFNEPNPYESRRFSIMAVQPYGETRFLTQEEADWAVRASVRRHWV